MQQVECCSNWKNNPTVLDWTDTLVVHVPTISTCFPFRWKGKQVQVGHVDKFSTFGY